MDFQFMEKFLILHLSLSNITKWTEVLCFIAELHFLFYSHICSIAIGLTILSKPITLVSSPVLFLQKQNVSSGQNVAEKFHSFSTK